MAASGNADQIRHWLARCDPALVEQNFLELRQKMLRIAVANPALCRRMLDTVMPVLADPQLGFAPLFAAFLFVAARVDPNGKEVFQTAVEFAQAQNLPVLAAKGTVEWAHWFLRQGKVRDADNLLSDAQRTLLGTRHLAEAEQLWVDRAQAATRTGDWSECIRCITEWISCARSRTVRSRLMLELAQCQLRNGEPILADAALRSASLEIETNSDDFSRHLAAVYRGQWFWCLGAHDCAQELFTSATTWFQEHGYETEAAIASANLASLDVARDEHLLAATQRLTQLARSVGRDPLFEWQIKINLAAGLEKLQQYAEARTLYHELASAAPVRDWERKLAELNHVHLRTLAERSGELQQMLADALNDPTVQRDPCLHFLACENMADWYRRNQDTKRASHYYSQALDCVEQTRLSLPWEFLRRRFQQARLRVFDRLQEMLVEQKMWTDAWHVADRAKAQSFVDFLGGSYPVLTPEDHVAFRRVRRELTRAYQRAALEARGQHIDELECRLEHTLGQGRRHYVHAAGTARQDFPAFQSEDVALLEYVRVAGGWGAYVLRGGCTQFHRLSLQESESSVEARILKSWRGYLAGGPAFEHKQWNTESAEWFQEFVAPLQSELEGVRRAFVVPHGKLCLLSWAGLWNRQRSNYWIDELEDGLVVLPGARIAQILSRPDERRAGDLCVVAQPTSDLVFAQMEAEWVAGQFGSACRLVEGPRVTAGLFRRLLPRCRWLHFSGHGHFYSPRPMASYLELGHAQRWTGWDMLVSRLPGATVVLSACEVGSAQAEAADEWLGLLRGLLMGGASSIVAPLWETSDFASLPFMQAFYEKVVKTQGDLAVALRSAQLRSRALGQWAEQAITMRGTVPAGMSWAQAIDLTESQFAVVGDATIASSGITLLDAGLHKWRQTANGRLARDGQLWEKVWSLLAELAMLAHPRHWAAFQLYGADRAATFPSKGA